MPQYDFLCQACQKKFTKMLTISEMEKGGVKCPDCGSEKVQRQFSGFFAITRKKS